MASGVSKVSGVVGAMVLAAAGTGYLMSTRPEVPASGAVAGADECLYCVYFDPRTRMVSWTYKLGRPCETGWTASSDQQGTPCEAAVPTPAPTLATPVASATPTRAPTPAVAVSTPTPAPTPGAWSLALPAGDRVVLIECPPGACWIDGHTSAWVLSGPWTMRVVQP